MKGPRTPIGSIGAISVLAILHLLWLAVAVYDHGFGRVYDALDVYNAVAALGMIGLIVMNGSRARIPSMWLIGGADLAIVAVLSVVTIPLGN